MKKSIHLLIAVFLTLSIVYPYTPTGAVSIGAAEKAVIISIDGARPDFVRMMIEEGSLKNIAKVIREGVMAEYGIGVFPPVTATSHASIACGATPGVTGIVGNTFYDPVDGVKAKLGLRVKLRSGFDSRSLLAEPLWRTTHKVGLPTVVISFGQSTPVRPEEYLGINGYDVLMSFSRLFYHSATGKVYPGGIKISLTEAVGWNITVKYEGKPMESKVTLPLYDFIEKKTEPVTLHILITDEVIDGKVEYNKVYVTTVKSTAEPKVVLSPGKMSKPVRLKALKDEGTACFKVMELAPDASEFRLYHTRIYSNDRFASRPLIAKEIYDYAGPFFGDADGFALERGWIDEETYMETLELTGRWFVKATEYVLKKQPWRVFFTYQVVTDNIGHAFTGQVTPGHPYYKEEERSKYWGYIKRAYEIADEQVGVILKNTDEKTLIVVASDHGMAPISKRVYINTILHNLGFQPRRIVGGKIEIIWPETKAYNVKDGYIYLNLKGRDFGGVVDPADYNSLVDELVSKLSQVKDPDTGELIFDLVVRMYYMKDPKKLEALRVGCDFFGLGGPASDFKRSRVGDVLVVIKPGYIWHHGLSPKVFESTGKYFTGAHVYLPNHPEMGTIFIARGPGVKKLGLTRLLSPIRIIDIAPTVAHLLGVPHPANTEGKVIIEALETAAEEDVRKLRDEVAGLTTRISELESLIRRLQEGLTEAQRAIADLTSKLATTSYTIGALAAIAVITMAITIYMKRRTIPKPPTK